MTGPGDPQELVQCAECRSGEHVDIRAGRGGTWVATCSGCRSEWSLSE